MWKRVMEWVIAKVDVGDVKKTMASPGYWSGGLPMVLKLSEYLIERQVFCD